MAAEGGWQQQYNQQLLAQRVKEELEKKARFEELERREIARMERARRGALHRELDGIQTQFRRARALRSNGPKPVFRCFMPFGKTVVLHLLETLDMVLSVGSHGFLGVWKHGQQASSNKDGPTLVDFSDLVGDNAGDLEHVVTSACLCHELGSGVPDSVLEEAAQALRQHQDNGEAGPHMDADGAQRLPLEPGDPREHVQVLVFCGTARGRGSLTLVTITKVPTLTDSVKASMSDADLLEVNKSIEMYEQNPSEAIQEMRIDLSHEGLRWVYSTQTLVDRPMINVPIQHCKYSSATQAIVVASTTSVRGYDTQLRNLWACSMPTLLRAPSAAGSGTGGTALSPMGASAQRLRSPLGSPEGGPAGSGADRSFMITALELADESGDAVFVGLERGDVLLVSVPKETKLDFDSPVTCSAERAIGGGSGAAGTGGADFQFEGCSRVTQAWLQWVATRRRGADDNPRSSSKMGEVASAYSRNTSSTLSENDLVGETGLHLFNKILRTPGNAKVALVAQCASRVTALVPHGSSHIFIGCEDGMAKVIGNEDGNASPRELFDSNHRAGPCGPVRSVLHVPSSFHGTGRLHDTGPHDLIVCDALGHLRVFAGTRLVAFAKSVESHPTRIALTRDILPKALRPDTEVGVMGSNPKPTVPKVRNTPTGRTSSITSVLAKVSAQVCGLVLFAEDSWSVWTHTIPQL